MATFAELKRQTEQELLAMIIEGVYPSGTPIPSRREQLTTSADPATNAAVSTAIVDVYDGVVITTTTTGNDQTIQDPTTVTSGKRFRVVNSSTSSDPVSVIIGSTTVVLGVGESVLAIWEGAAWSPTEDYESAGEVFYDNSGSTTPLVATDVDAALDEIDLNVATHIGDTSNPHSVDYSQVGADPAGTAASEAASAISGHESTYNHSNYDTAYGWGDHAGLYDPIGTASSEVGTHESTYNHGDYDTAYGWGDHSAAGYINDSDFTAGEGFMRKTGTGTYEAIKSNLNASVAPTVDDDVDLGYAVGSRWCDTTAGKEYVCLDNTDGAAAWAETTGASQSTYDEIVTTATQLKTALETNHSTTILVDGSLVLTADITASNTPATHGRYIRIDFTAGSGIDFASTYQIIFKGQAGNVYHEVFLNGGSFTNLPTAKPAFDTDYFESYYGRGFCMNKCNLIGATGTLTLGYTPNTKTINIIDTVQRWDQSYFFYLSSSVSTTTAENYRLINSEIPKLGKSPGATTKTSFRAIGSSMKITNGANDLTPQGSFLTGCHILETRFKDGAKYNIFDNCRLEQQYGYYAGEYATASDIMTNTFSACTDGQPGYNFSGNNNLFGGDCTTTVAQGELVYQTSFTDTYDQADATDTTKPACAVLVYKYLPTSARFKTSGIVNGYTGLTIGGKVYLSETPGGVTQTKPTTAGALIQEVGVAVSATEILFNIVPTDKTLDTYGVMYLNDNSTAQVIETASTPIPLRNFTLQSSLLDGMTSYAGTTGAITAYSDYDGTVSGTTLVTSTGHGLNTGEPVYIRGTTNYNGKHIAHVVDPDTFYIEVAFVADDGASDWDTPDGLIPMSMGTYRVHYELDVMEAVPAGSELVFNIVGTGDYEIQGKSTIDVGVNATTRVSGVAYFVVGTLETYYPLFHVTVTSDGTNDVTCVTGTMDVQKIK